MNYSVVIPAAGMGKRMKLGYNKILHEVLGKPIIHHTVSIFEKDPDCTEIHLAASKDEIKDLEAILSSFKKVKGIYEGGKERQDSIYNALVHVENREFVMVHDGARPLLDSATLNRIKASLKEKDAVICGVPVKSTLKTVVDGVVTETIDRSSTFEVHTPQAFCYNLLIDAYRNAREQNLVVTDDSMMVEALGEKVHVVLSNYNNIKVTTREDLAVLNILLGSE